MFKLSASYIFTFNSNVAELIYRKKSYATHIWISKNISHFEREFANPWIIYITSWNCDKVDKRVCEKVASCVCVNILTFEDCCFGRSLFEFVYQILPLHFFKGYAINLTTAAFLYTQSVNCYFHLIYNSKFRSKWEHVVCLLLLRLSRVNPPSLLPSRFHPSPPTWVSTFSWKFSLWFIVPVFGLLLDLTHGTQPNYKAKNRYCNTFGTYTIFSTNWLSFFNHISGFVTTTITINIHKHLCLIQGHSKSHWICCTKFRSP